MKKIWSLLKMQMDNKTDLLKTASPKTMIPALIKVVVLLAAITFAVSYGLSYVSNILKPAINAELIGLLLLGTQLLSLIFAVGNVISTLYMCHDNQMLICLPVTPNQLFISKILMIYIREVAASSIIILPLFLTLGSFSSFGASFYLSLPMLVLLMPIFPIVVAAFLSLPIMWIIKFLKKHTLLSIIVIFGLVGVCLWGYFLLIEAVGAAIGEFDLNEQVAISRRFNASVAAIGKSIPLYYQVGRAMLSFDMWHWFLTFALVCVAVSTAAVLFTRHFFFKVAMSNLENTVKAKKRVKKFKKRSRFVSLFTKEVFCVFRSTSEMFEYFLFTILMPFIVFSCDRLVMTAKVENVDEMIAGAHIMIVAILAMLSNISSASAISRDGGNFHTSKTIPVDFFTQMFVKFSFNAVFTIAAILATAIVSSFVFPVWQVALGSVAVAMAAVGHIAYCISCDIKNPTVNAQGDEESSAVSKSTTKCLVVGMFIGFIMGLIVMLMAGVKHAMLPYLVIIVLAFLYMINRVVNLVLRINHNYDKIEM